MDTTTQVLNIFLNNPGKSISGQYISDQIYVSRNAVWKAIEQLRKNGYVIEGFTNKGYQLTKIPNQVDKYYLQAKLQNFWTEVIVEEKVESTNKLLKEKADAGQKEGTVVVAKEQTGGRGRLGRLWESQKGGLWFSILLRPTLPMEELSLITLTMAAAVREAISNTSGLDIKIKWPNDILFQGKKICGILTEVKGDMDRVGYVVVGIGINVNNSIPKELQEKAISLKTICQNELDLRKKSQNEVDLDEAILNQVDPYEASQNKACQNEVDINELLISVLKEIETHYKQFLEGDNQNILEINRQHSALIGNEVEIASIKGTEQGVVQNISEDGSLLVKQNNTTKKVVSGDVTLKSWYTKPSQN